MIKNSQKLTAIILTVAVISVFALFTPKSSAMPTVTITSPSAGQAITGTAFTATGTATPNTTIVLSSGGTSFAQTKSDGSGNWSVDVDTLPAGDTELTAKAIENPEFGYFGDSADFSSFDINRIRLTDNTINPGGGGWPIASSSPIMALAASPVSSLFYSGAGGVAIGAPGRFDSQSPANPATVSGGYPANVSPNVGSFNSDGTKFYAPNIQGTQISVINTATNAWIQDISVAPAGPVTAWRSPQDENRIYVPTGDGTVRIINTLTDEVIKTVPLPCTPGGEPRVTTAGFSADSNYPYYFVPCTAEGSIVKLKLSDDSVVEEYNTGSNPVTLGISPDNKRIFFSNLVGSPDADKMKVIDAQTGALIQTIQLTSGAFGFISTPDFQKIFISTPGNLSDTFVQNMDVIDTETYAVTQVATDGMPFVVTYSPAEVAFATVNVSFVLGAQAASTTPAVELAKTGLFIALATPIGLFLVGGALYTYYDYKRHKQPLQEAVSDVPYTYFHHLKVVSVPLAKYRFSVGIDKKLPSRSDQIRRI